MKMRKQALSEQAEFALNGLAIGAGTAGVVALIRQLAEAKRQQDLEKKRKSAKISPNTIVLRVRKSNSESEKNASAGSVCNNGCKKVSVKPCVESKEVHPLAEGQLRETNGRFTTLPQKEAQAKDYRGFFRRVWDEGSGLYLGGATAVGGFYLVHKLMEKLEQNRLKKQLDAAQTEYLDLLDGKTVKGAEAFSDMFLFNDDKQVYDIENQVLSEAGLNKSAGATTDIKWFFRNLGPTTRHLGAGAVCTYLLGITGSAYVAKKLMEQRFEDQGKEEAPNKQVKILMKAGESTFEVQPEHVLATVDVLRDYISDSTPRSVLEKKAYYDYSFLDDIAKQEGGKQWLLNMYAHSRGIDVNGFDPTDLSRLSGWTGIKYMKTLDAIKGNPAAHREAIRDYVVNNIIRNNPKEWFSLLGDSGNKELVNGLVSKSVRDNISRIPILGWLSRVFPAFGDWIAKLPQWYFNNTESGRASLQDRLLRQFGVSNAKQRENIRSQYVLNDDGTWGIKDQVQPAPATPPAPAPQPTPTPPKPAPQPAPTPPKPAPQPAATPQPASNPKQMKKSGFDLSDALAFVSRSKTVTDETNESLSKKLDEIIAAQRKSTAAKHKEGDGSGNSVIVSLDPELEKLLSEKDKKAILSSFK